MSRKISIAILVLIGLCVTVVETYACWDHASPVADLEVDRTQVRTGFTVTFDGSAS